jgi:hypothetical protein
MKKYGEVEVKLHSFLISALYEVSDQRHAKIALTPGQRTAGTI